MANTRKSYFLAPSWEISPDEVQLGSVVENFTRPQRPLSAATLLDQIDTAVSDSPGEQSSGTAKSSHQWQAGLFAKFVQFITIGGDMSYTSSSTHEVEYTCDAIKTRRFTPSLAYIGKAAADKNVKDHLKIGGVGTKVFMITGIKTATNITITTTEEVKSEATAHIGVDIPAIQLPIGPKGSRKHDQLSKHTRTIAGPILFAFQVEKMRLNRKHKVVSSEYVEGAMLGQKTATVDDYVIERAGEHLEEDEAEDFDVFVVPGHDDGEDCNIIVPEPQATQS